MQLTAKTISSLDKCFLDEDIDKKREINSLSALCGETLCFQIAYVNKQSANPNDTLCYLHVDSPIREMVKISRVDSVPVRFTTYGNCTDENYLRKTAGLYPDLMIPIDEKSEIYPTNSALESLWIEAEIPKGFEGGDYPIKLSFMTGAEGSGYTVASAEFEIKVIPADLPEQSVRCTSRRRTQNAAQKRPDQQLSEGRAYACESCRERSIKQGDGEIA